MISTVPQGYKAVFRCEEKRGRVQAVQTLGR